MTAIATLCGGFGGVEVGALAAGLEPAWSIELDPAIAAVAEANLGHRIHVADLLDCDPRRFDAVDVLHASPPCPNFSVANANSSETELDLALAHKVAEFVTALRPRIFTLENVWAYRHSRSWATIEDALHGAGYWLHVDHVNAADYGVPQTRKRMIVRAILGGFVPYLPEPMPWVGWYAAIEDLLPSLPDNQFAPWQLARLPADLCETMMLWNMDQTIRPVTQRKAGEPVPTVDTGMMRRPSSIPVAFLMQVQGEAGDGVRYAEEPMQTVTVAHSAAKYRAFLIDGQNSSGNLTVREGERPSFTLTNQAKGIARAWLVNESSTMEVRAAAEPAAAQVASSRNSAQRGLLDHGRVVAMTPRALARFQSFPDWYELPANARLAAKGIGNAVPPLLYQRIITPLLEVL